MNDILNGFGAELLDIPLSERNLSEDLEYFTFKRDQWINSRNPRRNGTMNEQREKVLKKYDNCITIIQNEIRERSLDTLLYNE